MIGGIDPLPFARDPYVGFSGTVDLFVLEDGDYVTAVPKRSWFNEQRFPATKAEGTFRIFSIGGSTTYGRPYEDQVSFSGWLRELLAESAPNRHWEVVNAGGISYASYRVALLMEELAAYEPDLFLVYTGHNEFLERRSYSRILNTPRAVRSAGDIAARFRIFSAGRLVVERAARTASDPDLLPPEVDTILEHSVGPKDYHRDDEQRRLTVDHFRFNLNRMVDIARSAGAQIGFITPESNLRDCSPFKAQFDSDLSVGDRDLLNDLLVEADETADPEVAVESLTKAAAVDPRYAGTYYALGRALYALGRDAEARQAFERALEEDVCPLRAIGAIRQAVVATASERGALLVDLGEHVREASERGIPGAEIFQDHVHMTAEGYGMIARATIEELVLDGILPGAPGAQVFERVSERILASIDARAHGAALRNLAKVLDWAGKHEEAARLASQAFSLLGEDLDTLSVLGHAAANRGDLRAAENYFRLAARMTSDTSEPFFDWGTALLNLGWADQAIPPLTRAMDLSPKPDPDVLFNLGLALQQAGRATDAEARFREILALDKTATDAASSLAAVLLETNRPTAAAVVLEETARLAPKDARLEFAMGTVLVALGRNAEAAQRYREAIRLDPGHTKAHNNLGMTLLLLNDSQGAIESLRRAVEIAPEAETHNHLANALMLAGDPKEAGEQFAAAIRRRPDWPLPRTQWSWFLSAHPNPGFRDSNLAIQMSEKAVELTSRTDPQALDALAAAYAESGRFGDAAGIAREALTLLEPLGRHQLAAEVQGRLELYENERPFRLR